ncbi:type IV secretion system protein [Campylobacter sp. faydin G-140]|uniref:type IV secretion system protein n=1 Tax=Campylobacter anatolicus TaxID=2829105 RepID=UPI001B9D88A5|nr:type IV secretion system protein [Campylobacter anatolicus]MBR8466520.1 type IV secretion system protein [Campylobacter anatolicus]
MADSKDMAVIKDDKWLNDLIGITNDIITKLLEGIYKSVSEMLHNNVSYTIVMMVIMFWLLNILKNGYPTRGEIFNAGKWLFMVCFVMAIFGSYSVYESFISWLMIPAQWVRGGVSVIFDTNSADGFAGMVTSAINKISTLGSMLWDKTIAILKNEATLGTEWLAYFKAPFMLFWYGVYYLVFMIAVFGVTAIIFVSTFMASLLLCGCAIVLPFLTISTLKQYFFSWLKLFISYTLYAPLGLIVLSLAVTPINNLTGLLNENKVEQILNNQFSAFFAPILICTLCIYLLKQIPDWIQQIVGASGGAMGTSAGSDMAKTAGAVGIGGALGAGLAYSISRVAGGGFRNFAKSIGSAISGGLQGSINATPGGRTLQKASEAMLGGIANQTENIGGIAGKTFKTFKGGFAVP